MADEVKKEEKGAGAKKALSTLLKVVLGLVFLGLAVYLLYNLRWWGDFTLPLIKGCAGPFLVLAGLITLAIAKE
ncbi:MAG: hypothetical protein NTZ92_02065 [Candidatus Omnitrophica bacterium]|nr:hypothetical protein [Candidatus Omnitrophota bacterium]